MTAASATRLPRAATSLKATKILMPGGCGLSGSALTRRLVAAGSQGRVLDNLDPDSGANRTNLEGLEGKVEAVIADIREADAVRRALLARDVLFNLAAQSSHLGSMQAPLV